MRSGSASARERAVPAGSVFSSLGVVLHDDQVVSAGLCPGQQQPAEQVRPGRRRQQEGHERERGAAQQRQAEQHHDHQAGPGQERFQQTAQVPGGVRDQPMERHQHCGEYRRRGEHPPPCPGRPIAGCRRLRRRTGVPLTHGFPSARLLLLLLPSRTSAWCIRFCSSQRDPYSTHGTGYSSPVTAPSPTGCCRSCAVGR